MQFVSPKFRPYGSHAHITNNVSIINLKRVHTLDALDNFISTGMVLIGIGLFIVEELDEAVVTSGEKTAKEGTNPVDVVSLVEIGSSNARTE